MLLNNFSFFNLKKSLLQSISKVSTNYDALPFGSIKFIEYWFYEITKVFTYFLPIFKNSTISDFWIIEFEMLSFSKILVDFIIWLRSRTEIYVFLNERSIIFWLIEKSIYWVLERFSSFNVSSYGIIKRCLRVFNFVKDWLRSRNLIFLLAMVP